MRAERAATAAILAGGRSRRMGEPKAGVELAGRPLIAHAIEAVEAAGLVPVVIAKAASPLPELSCRVIAEPAEQIHPLTGIIAALERLDQPLVVLACDVPLVPPALLAELAGRAGDLVLPADPRPQPLVARYTPALLPRLRAALVTGEPLIKLATELDGDVVPPGELRAFGDPEQMFANVNEPADLERIERLVQLREAD